MREYPLTNGDLRDLADSLDEVEATVLSANKMIGRIEVNLPDRPDEVVGHFERFDGDPDTGWGFREKQ